MKQKNSPISIASYDDIFKTDNPNCDDTQERVQEIPLTELHSYKNHPFYVLDDEAMQKTVESILEYGVLTPGIARPRVDGGYEIIAGHRRKRACELAEIETMPFIIRDLDDDEATIIMVDTNLQRETLLFSELAFAYKMKIDAIKRQSSRTSKNGVRVGHHLKGKSIDIIAEESGESRNQIQRYVRLTLLVPEILQMVDVKRIGLSPAVELSFLTGNEQSELLNGMEKYDATPSLSQAQRLKQFSKDGKLTVEVIDAILSEEKTASKKITLSANRLKKYFPSSYSTVKIEETIFKLLEDWQKEK